MKVNRCAAQGSEHAAIAIVGTGFAGLAMGIRLKQAGINDFTILEQAEEVGGTWRDNDYPGAACDVESHLYSFSFEPNPRWTRQFSPQPEILAYLKHCTDKYGLRPHIRFGAAVTRATFDERAGIWTIETRGREPLNARVLVLGCGGLSRPAYPDLVGVERFAGTAMHSARWDHTYPLEGKTVAVVGTGASAVQIVPAIAPHVARLRVFQRTPPWIVPKWDSAISDRRRAAFRQIPLLQKLVRAGIYSRRELTALGFVVEPRLMTVVRRLALRHLTRSISDADLRRKLTPSYVPGCKRILPTNDFYPALERDNVDLITEGIREIREHGIVTNDGAEHPADAIVFATGFQAAEAVAPFEIRGRAARELDVVWRGGAEAYLGTAVTGFPNAFMIVGPNTGLGHNSMVLMIESQVEYILSAIQAMRARRLKFVDVRPEVQERYNGRLRGRLAKTVWSKGGCKSWYVTRTGKNTTLWPGFTFEFRARTRRFDVRDYELGREDAAASETALAITP
jgi:cation diffusion facilitator CzcD-associated flavoprotein CzcO